MAVATLLPFLYVVVFFLGLLFHLTNLIFQTPERNLLMEFFDVIFWIHLVVMFWIVLLMVVYLAHIVRNPRLKNESRAVWVIVVIMASILAMPIYWYLEIWREQKVVTSPLQTS